MSGRDSAAFLSTYAASVPAFWDTVGPPHPPESASSTCSMIVSGAPGNVLACHVGSWLPGVTADIPIADADSSMGSRLAG